VLAEREALQSTGIWDASRVLYLPRGQGLAMATRDQGVVFIDPVGKRTSRAPITRANRAPIQMSVDAAGNRLAVAWGNGGGVTVHDLASGETLGEFANSRGCAISPDGQWVACQGPQSDILLHRIGSNEAPKSLGRNDAPIRRLST
jgi:hypothetical protein